MESILRSLASSRTGEEEALLPHHHRGVRRCPRPQDDCNYSILFDGNALEQSSVSFANALHRFAESTYHVHSSSAQSTDVAVSALSSSSKAEITLWLYTTCTRIPSPLPPLQLAQAVLSSIVESGGANIESSLFELIGEGESSVEALFEIVAKVEDIRAFSIIDADLLNAAARYEGTMSSQATTTTANNTLDRLNRLRADAYEASNLVYDLRSEMRMLSSSLSTKSNGGDIGVVKGAIATHSVARTSDKDAEKSIKRAIKSALLVINEARDAGSLTEDDELRLRNIQDGTDSNNGSMFTIRDEEAELYRRSRGLNGMTASEMNNMRQNLLPEGTRVFDDGKLRGLPQGTVREMKEGIYEKVIIPPPFLDKSTLPNRINLDEVLGRDTDERSAFEGTKSLNPMQSVVFHAAYNTRENLLICAPTGAGKTNVAMLTVISHLRDVGLIGSSRHDNDIVSSGKKIVYIAPMKALAQEVVEKFSSKLKKCGIIVRELTGDMQLSRAEADAAHVLVTTPEKWDVVTRRGGDGSLGATCGLLIIDEVHLLADERGAVIESVVARLHRWVESSQRQVRLVGLSATLPNYEDVATFLRVEKGRGLFHFGPEHRPVPLQQTFIGITSKGRSERDKKMDDVCYEVVAEALRSGYQVMVFVHSRKGTGTTAKALAERAAMEGELEQLFIGEEGLNEARTKYIDRAEKSQNKELREHFRNGMGIHHAGMLRHDRKLSEQMFSDGAICVLCCTATLAWGINLPAHTVVIKGTDVYQPEKGRNVDLSILDVQQIFGRAGRPQFDTSGDATLITTHDAMIRFLDKLVRATPIESNFIKQLADHLNAEVVGGTVTNIREAIQWLRYTYLFVRMCKNPLAYGISAVQHESDPTLLHRSRELAIEAAKLLDERKMVRFNSDSGNIAVCNLGRVASHFYIRNQSVATFNEMLEKKRFSPTDADLLHVMCCADEFENVRVRPEELDEVDRLKKESCPLDSNAPVEEFSGKCNVLLQSYISKARVSSFTLISDTNYIASNAGRVARALFEMCLKGGNAPAALKFLRLAKSTDKRFWWFQSPLRAFEYELKKNVFVALEDTRVGSEEGYGTLERIIELLDMDPKEVGELCHCFRDGALIQKFVRFLPRVNVTFTIHPITKNTLRFRIELDPMFNWSGRYHGGAEGFWVWIEDNNNDRIYHNEYVLFQPRHFQAHMMEVIVPVYEPMPQQYFIRVVSDSWVGCEDLIPVSFRHVLINGLSSPTYFTNLLDLTPLPTKALANPHYEELYSNRFDVFNPIQTQLFHVLYHSDSPVLLGAPTGSGKTIVAELALLRMKQRNPRGKCVYIAPLKSLARERLKEWRKTLGSPPLKWNVLELSGDTSHDSYALNNSDILICTPEKWDLISRGWRGVSGDFSSSSASSGKRFVKEVALLIIDEIHLLGEDRGAVLEAIVSRTRLISRHVQAENEQKSSSTLPLEGNAPEMTRIMGLSTALANPFDLADWIGIDTDSFVSSSKRGLYNFRPSVRPVPMVVHIQGFQGRHYCPRMATMNKPCFAAIKDLSPNKPSMIFVASRRQTRLTALDLISHAAGDDNPKSFLHCDDEYIEAIAQSLNDKSLCHTITFGIGLHHAGLTSHDREVVERLFLEGAIQVLIATATLAWGVNLPAHLVIVKGTEFFDGKLSRYVDYPVTDILQMMGRAGRPQFDKEGVAVIMCEESKKTFLKKFLYEPFPVESCLGDRMCETINAEISIGTINSYTDAIAYLKWTFYARRVKLNPSYYGAKSSEDVDIEDFFLTVIQETTKKLQDDGCVRVDETEGTDYLLTSTPLGHAAGNFYLKYQTPKQMMLGTRGLRKVLAQHAQNLKREAAMSKERFLVGSDAESMKYLISIHAFDSNQAMCIYAIANILFELSATCEFKELPVRHNEEELNLELSRSLPWGYDLSKVSWWMDTTHHPGKNILDIMASPHTKCFLLLQAFIFKSKLPISDYINDMRSVVEQIPRLLAAMHFIALDDKDSAGNFAMFSSFPLVRRILKTGIIIGTSHPSLSSSTPNIKFGGVKIVKVLVKGSNNHTGRLEFEYSIEMNGLSRMNQKESPRDEKGGGLGVTFILGTIGGDYLLSQTSLVIGSKQSYKKQIAMEFDWNTAEANAGQGNSSVNLRVIHEFLGGLDLEVVIALKCWT